MLPHHFEKGPLHPPNFHLREVACIHRGGWDGWGGRGGWGGLRVDGMFGVVGWIEWIILIFVIVTRSYMYMVVCQSLLIEDASINVCFVAGRKSIVVLA